MPNAGVAISSTVLKLYLASASSDLSNQIQYMASAAAQANAAYSRRSCRIHLSQQDEHDCVAGQRREQRQEGGLCKIFEYR